MSVGNTGLKKSTIVTGCVLIAAIGTTIAQNYLIGAYIQGVHVSAFGLFMVLHPVAKLILMQIMLGAVLLLMLALIRLPQSPLPNSKPRGVDIALWVVSAILLFLGLFSVFYSELAIYQAIQEVGPVSFAVTAPSRVEWLFVLSFALWPVALALGLQQLALRRKAQA